MVPGSTHQFYIMPPAMTSFYHDIMVPLEGSKNIKQHIPPILNTLFIDDHDKPIEQ